MWIVNRLRLNKFGYMGEGGCWSPLSITWQYVNIHWAISDLYKNLAHDIIFCMELHDRFQLPHSRCFVAPACGIRMSNLYHVYVHFYTWSRAVKRVKNHWDSGREPACMNVLWAVRNFVSLENYSTDNEREEPNSTALISCTVCFTTNCATLCVHGWPAMGGPPRTFMLHDFDNYRRLRLPIFDSLCHIS